MSKLILLVDDDPDARVELASALLACGFRVRLSTDREEALVLADLYKDMGLTIDLAIVDLQLPGTSGQLLTKELRGKTPSVPVFEVSGPVDKQILSAELRQGKSNFISNAIAHHEKIRQFGTHHQN
ncbi:MAG TPA: response regulator [Dissulfurispiraceae bacterium]|nr:response regulator [Dissulfurispiraceae bacterium]